jgi:hypothetical protein
MQKVLSTIDFQPVDYQLSATFDFQTPGDFGDFQGSHARIASPGRLRSAEKWTKNGQMTED